MKRLAKIFILFTTIFTISVKANSIDNINMDIYINKDGNAHVTETWIANLDEGTEGYRSYGNMGNATISNLKVTDGDTTYTDIGTWDISASFDDKAYKSGINKTVSTVELCFGISEYGYHTYKIEYDINGFIAQTTDSQMIYWELIPTDLAKLTNNVSIKIYADEKFSDELPVWGYGNYGGYAYVYDGVIEVSNDNLGSDEYIVLLAEFPQGTFATTNIVENDFNYYYNRAEEGADHYTEKESVWDVIVSAFVILVNVFVWVIIIAAICASSNSGNKSGSFALDFGEKGKKLPKDVNLFRNLPCNKDIYRAYWVAYNYNLMKKQTDFLGVILLKWLKEDKIRIENKESGKIFKKENATIVFDTEECICETELESKLYKYMYEASKDGILESKEFEKWCSKNYDTILKWFDKVLDYESDLLLKEGKLSSYEKTTMKIFKSTRYLVDQSMYEEAIQMKGLKQFFKEFENMKDKEAIEVKFWEEYLMFAQIFGVADKVAKQFKELYPDMITDYSYDSIIFVNGISHSGMVSASSARSRAESYSSGGGGFSSGGGGGGSFGGGGGGGFR